MLEQLVQLRQLLADRFDEGELRTLCFDLGVDYEDLPAEGRSNKARELAAYLDRHDRIPDLLEVGQRLRPEINWRQIYLNDQMDDLRARRDQADQARRDLRARQRVVNLRPLDVGDTFKDRVRETQELCQYLTQGSVRMVSIVGRGGMGKTALVSRVLADLERGALSLPGEKELAVEGILYLSARSTGLSLERIYTDVGRMLGEPAASRLAARWASGDTPLVAKVEYLLEMMQSGLYIILLDNLEDLLAQDGSIAEEGLRLFVERCLTQPGGARLIATSREEVRLAETALRGARRISLREGLPEDEAIALLRDLDSQGTLGLRDAPEGELRRAAQLTRGIPRALEILAGILSEDPAASLSRLLADENLFGEQVVEELVASGYRRLGENERRVVEAMAVLERPVEETVVAFLLHSWYPGLDVRGGLRRLASSYFVSANRVTGEYSLHPLDRDYAYRHLPEGQEPGAYHRRNLELRAAEFYASLRKPESEWKAIDDLAPQLAEFEHRIRAGDYDNACRMLGPIDFQYMWLWGHYARLAKMRESLVGRLTDPALQAENLGELGRMYDSLGRSGQALNLFQNALVIARQLGDLRRESIELFHLGLAYRHLGQIERAIEFFEQSQVSARARGSLRGEARCLSNLGVIYATLGQFGRALEFQQQALPITRSTQDQREEAFCLEHHGEAHYALGDLQTAREFYLQALQVIRAINYRNGEARIHANLGDVYLATGDVPQALEVYNTALPISREMGYLRGESRQLLGLGRTWLAAGELDQARQCCEKAMALPAPAGYLASLVLASVLLRQRDPAAGEAFAQAAVRCQAALDKTSHLYEACYALATALVGQVVCDPRWADTSQRAELLAPALTEYRKALEITSAPGVVADALRDLELIQAAGVSGLEPVFDLLKSALK